MNERRRKITSFSLMVLFIFSGLLLLFNTPDGINPMNTSLDATPSFSGGDGSVSNPYQISNITQLQNVSSNLSASYVLINDIEAFETKFWNGGEGFDPIGTGQSSDHFRGSLNGKNHSIFNLYIYRKSENNIGLFSNIEGGKIQNINLINVTIVGNAFVGGIACLQTEMNDSISNCYVSGIIEGVTETGGIVGRNKGIIRKCSTNCTIRGRSYSGGIVGNAEYPSNITECHSEGSVITQNTPGYVGGLIGHNTGIVIASSCKSIVQSTWDYTGGLIGLNSIKDNHINSGVVINCSTNCIVGGEPRYTGGLVGANYGKILGSFSIGITRSTRNSVGGLVGLNGGTIYHSYSKGNVEGLSYIGGLVGNAQYPSNISHCFSSGSINSSSEYVGGLIGINDGIVTSSTAETTVRGVDYYIGGLIGTNKYNFQDPDSGVVINCSSKSTVIGYKGQIGGLVGHNRGKIFDSNSVCTIISTAYEVGGLVGWNQEGIVINSHSQGIVSGDTMVGGLIGMTSTSAITKSSSNTSVTGNNSVGGFIGLVYYSNINECYSMGLVKGNGEVGGFIGNYSTSLPDYQFVNNSYSGCSIIGDSIVGGFIGGNNGGKIKHCYSSGSINANSSVGGFAGNNTIPMNSCYYNNESSNENGVGEGNSEGVFGKYAFELKYIKTFKDSNWNFKDVWDIFEGETFPYLQWEIHGTLEIISNSPENATEDLEFSYQHNYQIIESDETYVKWYFTTNALWLILNPVDGVVSGTPTNEDVGEVWMNISVMGNRLNEDYKNFSFNVNNINDNPKILDLDTIEIFEDVPFFFDCEAVDIDPTNDVLTWEMETNASFIDIDPATGNISGIPTNDDVGTWWVLVNVSDGNGGFDEANVTITVIGVNDPPVPLQERFIIFSSEDPGEIIINIDSLFYDEDSEDLIVDGLGTENISVEILENNSIRIIFRENWYGTNNITITANDTQYITAVIIEFRLHPHNDRPINQNFTYNKWETDGNNVTFIAYPGIDVDNIDLIYEWDFGDGQTGFGREINHTYARSNASIQYNVALTIFDGIIRSETYYQIVVIDPISNDIPDDDDDDIIGDDDSNGKEQEFPILIVVIIGIVVLLIIIGIALFFMIRKKQSEEEPPKEE